MAAVLIAILLLNGSLGQHGPRQVRDTADGATQRVVLNVEPGHPERAFVPGAVGLSIETKELATHDLSATHASLVALLRLLGPGVLRVGGGSVDHSWWTSQGEASPSWATSVITPADLVALGRFLAATGWKAILGVDLGHYDPARAANEVRVAAQVLGSRLLGIEIGNEPDNYGKPAIRLRSSAFSADDYLEELSAYITAMRVPAPNIRLYGPDLASQRWLRTIAPDGGAAFSAISEHYYPTTYSVAKGKCKSTTVPTALELLSSQVREEENATLQTLIAAGEIGHSKTLISETNTTGSCDTAGGPATSPVFASALWSLDWALRVSSAGVSGLNFHGSFGHCGPYAASPICAEGHLAEPGGQAIARPEYYGLIAARQLEGGRFVPARLLSPRPLPDLTTWATVTSAGTVRIAIDNMATEGPTQQVLIPIAGYSATCETLVASSIQVTSGIKFGNATITDTGRWRRRFTRLTRVRRSFRVAVRPASAIIITLRPK